MAVTLLEGFENTPAAEASLGTGGPAWTQVLWFDAAATGGVTVARTTSNVTQGTYSWRAQGVSGSLPALTVGTFEDITATVTSAATIDIDVYVATINASDYVILVVEDTVTQVTQASTAGQSGAFILSIDPTGLDFSSLTWALVVAGAADLSLPLNGACDVYIDNLRADDGVSGGTAIPIFYNHLKMQGIS